MKTVIEIVKTLIIVGLLAYAITLINHQTDEIDQFKEDQKVYVAKMDSLKVISQQLVSNINLLDKDIDASKAALDSLNKKTKNINYTNQEALEFLRAFAAKYNQLFKDIP